MIVSRTPLRISFFGGGTDYPAWVNDHGGRVLATTIDKYSYITCRNLPPFFSHKHRIAYSKIELVKEISQIEHPAVRAVLDFMRVDHGVEIHYDGDLPARSGLGTSSAFTVGLINALMAMQGQHISKEQLAHDALYVEQEILKEAVGCQDQICAAAGGFNRIDFRKDGTFELSPVVLPKDRLLDLQSHLMLFFTGVSRIADPIAKSQMENLSDKEEALSRMSEMVLDGLKILDSGDLTDFGILLDEGWILKKSLSPQVSTPYLDDLYALALQNGAIGGKLLGAGGGGFLLLFVSPKHQGKISKALNNLVQVPFHFESYGSKIVLYQPNGLS